MSDPAMRAALNEYVRSAKEMPGGHVAALSAAFEAGFAAAVAIETYRRSAEAFRRAQAARSEGGGREDG